MERGRSRHTVVSINEAFQTNELRGHGQPTYSCWFIQEGRVTMATAKKKNPISGRWVPPPSPPLATPARWVGVVCLDQRRARYFANPGKVNQSIFHWNMVINRRWRRGPFLFFFSYLFIIIIFILLFLGAGVRSRGSPCAFPRLSARRRDNYLHA